LLEMLGQIPLPLVGQDITVWHNSKIKNET